jgi:transcriptional regulator with XRE-family HTH domain
MTTVGSRIKELRLKKDLTQEELAAQLGVKRSTLANWEIERSAPGYPQLMEMAKIFGVSADYLLGPKQNDVSYVVMSPEDLELLRRIRGLSLENRKTVETVVTSIECYERQLERGDDVSSKK